MDMDKSKTRHRRTLNPEQIEVLELLYKFRFGSNDLFAQYFGKRGRSFVFKRLSILTDQGLVGKRFKPSYRLIGKPAAYYLTPAGARLLQERRDPDKPEVNIKAIYKDRTLKDDFVWECLDIFAAYNRLRAEYSDRLRFFTRANLNYEQFDYFPQPLPNAFIRLRLGGEEKQFFLDFYYEREPIFVAVRRFKKYIEYAEEGSWEETGTPLPRLLFVCESEALQNRLRKQITKGVMDYADLLFASTSKSELVTGQLAIWQLTDDTGRKVTLRAIR